VAAETVSEIAACQAVAVDLVAPAPLAAARQGPAEAAHEPAVHVVLPALAAEEAAAGVAVGEAEAAGDE
jgi:hypothetical protein